MQTALERADRLLAVCTEAYFSSTFGAAELRAAFAGSAAAQGRIVPVLVEPVALPPLYASLINLDLTGLDEAAAAARLQNRLAGGRPARAPPFPRGGSAPADKPGVAGPGGRAAGGRVRRRSREWDQRPRTSGGSPGRCRWCGRFRPRIHGSPVETACSPSCGGDCGPASRHWWCRRCTGWVGWGR